MDVLTIPLASEDMKTPKNTIQSTNLVTNSSRLDLQPWWPLACLISKVTKSPSDVLQCLYKLYHYVQSIKYIKNWLLIHWNCPSDDRGMAFPPGGPSFKILQVTKKKCRWALFPLQVVPIDLENPSLLRMTILEQKLVENWPR